MLLSCIYKKQNINFVDERKLKSKNKNVFSVIVGVNGVGKSRLLAALSVNAAKIEKLPISSKEENLEEISKNLSCIYDGEFSNVIASSVSPFDKFPVIKRAVNNNYYRYLGVRGIGSENMGFAHSSRVVGNLICSSYKDAKKSLIIKNILSYLGYSDSLSVEFKLSSEFKSITKIIDASISDFKSLSYLTLDENQSLKDFIENFNKSFLSYVSTESQKERRESFDKIKHMFTFVKLIQRIYALGFNSLAEFFEARKNLHLFKSVEFSLDFNGFISNASNSKNEKKVIEKLNEYISSGILILKRFNIRKLGQRKIINISSASSGEQSVLVSLLGISAFIKDKSLILIDEPEICLHPSWQEKYIELLIECFSIYKGCHFVLATHSPQIISNLNSENCFIIKIGESETYSSSSFIKKSADYQLANIFRAPGHRNEYLLNKLTLFLADMSEGLDLNSERLNEINKILNFENIINKEDPVYKLIIILKKSLKMRSGEVNG